MNDYGYGPDVLPRMIATAARQRAKDALFVEELVPHFVPGPILEIGAGCGQLSELLAERGFDATASDIQPSFVEYVASKGVPARLVDALNLGESMDRPYANVLGGGPSTLITPDLEVVRQTYESVAVALPPGSRFIFVLPSLWGEPWSKPADHVRIAREAGFELVARFRHQVLPSSAYRRLPRSLLRLIERTIGRLVGIRTVFVYAAAPDDAARPGRPAGL
jgi:SAM-dependent methyltransferase